MVGEQKMHLLREIVFLAGGTVECDPAFLDSVLIEVIAVNQLLQHDVPLRMVRQVGGDEHLVKIAAMIVQIADEPDFALAGEQHHLLLAQRAVEVVFRGGSESVERFFNGDGGVAHDINGL